MLSLHLALFLGMSSWSGDTETSHELPIFAGKNVNLRGLADSF